MLLYWFKHCVHTSCNWEVLFSSPTPKLFTKYFNLISRHRNHVPSIRMNIKTINRPIMSLIMLNNFFRPHIMNRDMFRLGSSDNTLLKWMKASFWDGIIKTIILLNTLFLLNIPNHHLLILTTRYDCSHVARKVRTRHPVRMPNVRTPELESVNVPDLNTLIVTRGENKIGIGTEGNRPHSTSMSFYRFGFSGSTWKPQLDQMIMRSADNDILIRGEVNGSTFFSMPIKIEIPFRIGHIPQRNTILISTGGEVFPS